jgi:phosphoribosylpyrophosphate synthetase
MYCGDKMIKEINLNVLDEVDLIVFSDNQPHIRLKDVEAGDYVDVICSITSPAKLLQLAMTANAIWKAGARARTVFISYLLGARYDRVMVRGDSFDLEVISQIINTCNFMKVEILKENLKNKLFKIINEL